LPVFARKPCSLLWGGREPFFEERDGGSVRATPWFRLSNSKPPNLLGEGFTWCASAKPVIGPELERPPGIFRIRCLELSQRIIPADFKPGSREISDRETDAASDLDVGYFVGYTVTGVAGEVMPSHIVAVNKLMREPQRHMKGKLPDREEFSHEEK
jgi:hypothetical protein